MTVCRAATPAQPRENHGGEFAEPLEPGCKSTAAGGGSMIMPNSVDLSLRARAVVVQRSLRVAGWPCYGTRAGAA